MASKRKGPSPPPKGKKRATTSATEAVTAVSSPNLPTVPADTGLNSSAASESVAASEDDFRRITNELGPDKLHHLFLNLGIPQSDIEHAERSADTTDTRLRARAVLREWKKRHGRDATRAALFDAKGKICSSSSTDTLSVTFDVEVCKQELITCYQNQMSKVQLLPWFDEEVRDMDDLYVTLELEEKTTTGIKILAKNEDLVSLQTTQGNPSTRVLVKGVAGSGKSTLLAKLAYSWSQKQRDSPLSKFTLVFIISLREVQKDRSLIDAIFDQILAQDTGVLKQDLQMFIESHPEKVLILLDGFDEYKSKKNLDMEHIGKIITSTIFQNCRIILSSRPHEHFKLKQKVYYTSVKLLGFSSTNVQLYIKKFFEKSKERADTLFDRLGESDVLKSLAKIPVMLMLMCLLWEEDQKLPDTQSDLYHEFTMYLWREYRHRKNEDIDLNKNCEDEFNKILVELGQVALAGLCPSGYAQQEKIVFSPEDFEKTLYYIGCGIGLLTKERLRSNLNVLNAVTFLHKSFQEFCAAKYWADLFQTEPIEFKGTLLQIEDWGVLLRKLELMKFICGLVDESRDKSRDKSRAVTIIQHAISLFRKEIDRNGSISVGSLIEKDWGVLPILILLYESGITLDNFLKENSNTKSPESNDRCDDKPPLAQSFKMLFAKEHLEVYSSPPQSLPMFHYLIKSARVFSALFLGVIKSLTFDYVPLVMLDVLIDTLQYTTSVRNIHIVLNMKDDDDFEPSPNSLDKLGKALAGLSKVYKIHLRGASVRLVNLNSSFLHHLSTSVNRNKYTDLNLPGCLFKIADIEQLVSNLDNLTSLRLQSSTGCTQDVASMLEAIHSNIEHIILDNVDFGDAIRNINHLMTPNLQTVELRSTSLEVEHVRTLSEFISKAPNLKVLNLSYNTVGMAMVPLAQQLRHCRNLSKLDLSTSSITDEGIVELAQTFSYIPDLGYLDISANDLGNVAFNAIFENIHTLSKLKTLAMGGDVDQQCSPLVKECLGVLGKVVSDTNTSTGVNIRNDESMCQRICATASKYL